MKSFFTAAAWRVKGKRVARSSARKWVFPMMFLVVASGLSSCASGPDSFDLMLEQAGRQMFMIEAPVSSSVVSHNDAKVGPEQLEVVR